MEEPALPPSPSCPPPPWEELPPEPALVSTVSSRAQPPTNRRKMLVETARRIGHLELDDTRSSRRCCDQRCSTAGGGDVASGSVSSLDPARGYARTRRDYWSVSVRVNGP